MPTNTSRHPSAPLFFMDPCFPCSRGSGEGATSNHAPVGHDRAVGDDHAAVADDVVRAVVFLYSTAVDDVDVPADAAVLVHDGPLEHAIVADAQRGDAALAVPHGLALSLVIVGSH